MKDGISTYLSLVIMILLFLIGVGISKILAPQLKMMGEISKAIIAFHAADTGIERLGEAIFVGYHLFKFPPYGKCEEGKCDFSKCLAEIEFNSPSCGLPSMCELDQDCFCPQDKCLGNNFYDFPEKGICKEKKCEGCLPQVEINSSKCGALPSCRRDEDCPCLKEFCLGLEPSTIKNFPFKTPYQGTLPNGAKFETYILSPNKIKSLGQFLETMRAIEIEF